MGTTLIPSARSIREAVAWASAHGAAFGDFELVDDGIRYTAAELDDAAAAAIFDGFAPTARDDDDYTAPMPEVVRAAGRIVRRVAYATDAELGAMTQADVRLALRASCRALVWLNARLEVPDE